MYCFSFSQPPTTYTSHFSFPNTDDLEEQRKIAEGADALLNLAGVPTVRKRSPSHNLEHSPKRKRLFVSSPEPVEKPSQFRPRLLRAKRKSDNQKRKNNNNNNTLKKVKSESTHDEWVRHRRAIEESRNLR